MKITKAIIPVAGYGTRRLPITKAIEKSMLPIGNRPIIDYIVDDCIKAGIENIIFVVGENFEQLKTYFGRNELLEEYLEGKGKIAQLEEAKALSQKAKFHYIVQDQHQPYGTATPLWLCRDMVKPGEHFLYISGDQFYYQADGGSEAAHLIESARQAGTETAMLAVEVPHEEVYKYGIVKTRHEGDVELYESIVEKPTVEEAPTNLNNGTFWLLNDAILPCVETYMDEDRDSEYMITDIANSFVNQGHTMAVVHAKGEYLDGGSVEGWVHANNVVAGK
jgi:UTP--glucose-1-phosphate uridylyltransferase